MIKMTVDYTAVERHLSRVSKNLFGGLERAMDQIGKLLVKETKRNLNNKLLRVRSGKLLGSISHDTFTPAGTVVLEVRSEGNLPYAPIQNWGGTAGIGGSVTIKPTYYMSRTVNDKRRQIITIIERALTRAAK